MVFYNLRHSIKGGGFLKKMLFFLAESETTFRYEKKNAANVSEVISNKFCLEFITHTFYFNLSLISCASLSIKDALHQYISPSQTTLKIKRYFFYQINIILSTSSKCATRDCRGILS